MTDLATLHKLVWDFCAEAESYWPTPNPLDALRYAFTAAGKAMDAFLRSKRPGDARNSERQSTVEEELTNCAIMLLTALGPEWVREDWIDDLPQRDYILGDVVDTVSQALRFRDDYLVRDALFTIRCYGLDLATMIPQRLARSKARHCPEMQDNLLRVRMRKAAELARELHGDAEGYGKWYHVAHDLDRVADYIEHNAQFWHQVEQRMKNLASADLIPNQDGGLCEEKEAEDG